MRRFKAPSPAMIVASLALFVALGGTGYAARNAILSSPTKAQIIQIVKGVAPTLKVGGLATLPSGKSESGIFVGAGNVSGDYVGVSIVYPRPLAAPISNNNIIDVQGTSAAHCAGKGHADPGYLCFYDGLEDGVDVGDDFYSTDDAGLGKLGVFGYWTASSNNAYMGGSWTVTAP